MWTLLVIVIGLFVAIFPAILDAYRDANDPNKITMAQLYESMRIANEADVIFSIKLHPVPYDWAHEYCEMYVTIPGSFGIMPCKARGPHQRHEVIR